MKFRRRKDGAGVYLPPLGKRSTDEVPSYFFPQFWGTSDSTLLLESFRAVARRVAPGVHFSDNLFTWQRNNSMFDDALFVKAWESNAESVPDKAIVWRRYILACAAYHCVQLDGDFVECGAYTGVGVKTVIDYLGGERFPKQFWLYDLFEHEDGMEHHAMPEHGPGLHARVLRKFQLLSAGEGAQGQDPRGVRRAVARRDCVPAHRPQRGTGRNCRTGVAVRPRRSGGIIVLDDYEWSGPYRAQKLAEDPWFEARRTQACFHSRPARVSSSSARDGRVKARREESVAPSTSFATSPDSSASSARRKPASHPSTATRQAAGAGVSRSRARH